MIANGTRLRDKETGSIFRVTDGAGQMIRYEGAAAEGEVNKDQLHVDFDVLDDPVTREDIEALIKSKIDADEAETGLYNTGLAYVVVDRVDGEVTFEWFGDAMPFADLLPGN